MKRDEKECFALIQQIALLQDPNCIVCGVPSVAGHHVFGRGLAAAFNPTMVRGLCLNHHGYSHHLPESFGVFMAGFLGEGRYDELALLSREIVPYIDFEAKRDELKAILAELEGRVA